jgi:hypothetical protein
MKKISGLDKVFVDAKGEEFADKSKIKDSLMSILFSSKAEPKDALRISAKILPMLVADKVTGEFEDSDYDLIKTVVEKNELGLSIGIFGQLMGIFEKEETE